MKPKPTWFEVARRPRWIGALFIAMGVAVICALLAQWQAERSIEAPAISVADQQAAIANAKDISLVVQPGRTPSGSAVGTQVKAMATLNPSLVWVVSHRIQRDGTRGFWVLGTYADASGHYIVAPLGFTASKQQALAVQARVQHTMVPQVLREIRGRLSPSEAPARWSRVLESLSVGQLANKTSISQATRFYPLFLLITDSAVSGLDKITVSSLTEAQVNWLSAFYAVEWTAFCGFSFFMWWRLVRDRQLREKEDLNSEEKPE
ncbi:MAG: SURF1 family cytochrome oxidase biogenesis protein [Micrococcales bacterium]